MWYKIGVYSCEIVMLLALLERVVGDIDTLAYLNVAVVVAA